MCTYVYICFVLGFFSSLRPWDPLANYSAAFHEKERWTSPYMYNGHLECEGPTL